MKRFLLLTLFTVMTACFAMADEIVLECTYASNANYSVLLIIRGNDGEAMAKGNDTMCHYDREVKTLGDHVIILCKNADQETWVDDIYIIHKNKCFAVSPDMPQGSNFAEVTIRKITDASEIAAKKRDYRLANNQRGSGSRTRR